MSNLAFSYVVVCVSTDEISTPHPGALIRRCQQCSTSVWYAPMGDGFYGQGLAKFECTDCTIDQYQRGEIGMPQMSETTRRHLRSLGISEQQIEDVIFKMTLAVIGGKKRSKQR